MSARVVDAVFTYSQSKGASRLVLLAIADQASKDGTLSAYKRSHACLADMANVDTKTVSRVVRELVEMGELVVLSTGNGRRPSDYQIVLPGLAEGGRDAPPHEPTEGTRCPPRGDEVPPQGGQDAGASTTNGFPFFPVLSPARALERFEKFWTAYPARDGKKLGKGKTQELFDKLDYEDQRAAWVGAKNLALSIAAGGKFGPPDPDRWLRDRKWEDWQEPAKVSAGGAVAPPAPRPVRTTWSDHIEPDLTDEQRDAQRQMLRMTRGLLRPPDEDAGQAVANPGMVR